MADAVLGKKLYQELNNFTDVCVELFKCARLRLPSPLFLREMLRYFFPFAVSTHLPRPFPIAVKIDSLVCERSGVRHPPRRLCSLSLPPPHPHSSSFAKYL